MQLIVFLLRNTCLNCRSVSRTRARGKETAGQRIEPEDDGGKSDGKTEELRARARHEGLPKKSMAFSCVSIVLTSGGRLSDLAGVEPKIKVMVYIRAHSKISEVHRFSITRSQHSHSAVYGHGRTCRR